MLTEPKKRPERAWLILAGCILLQIGGGTYTNCGSLLYSPICSDLGFSNGGMAMFSTLRDVGMAIAFTFMPSLLTSGRLRFKLTFFAALSAVCFALQSVFGSLWQWYFCAFVLGLCEGGIVTMPSTLIINNWFKKDTGLALGIAFAAAGIPGVVFSPVLTAFIGQSGWRNAAVLFGAYTAANMLPATLFILRLSPKEAGCRAHGEGAPAQEATVLPDCDSPIARRRGVFAACIAIVCLPALAVQLTYQFSLFTLQEGLGLAAASVLTSIAMAGNIACKPLLGMLNDRFGTWTAARIGLASLVAGSLVFGFCRSLPLLAVGALLMGPSYGLTTMFASLIARRVYARQYKRRCSFLLTIEVFASAAIGSTLGFLSDRFGSYRPLSFATAFCCAVCIALSSCLAGAERSPAGEA